MTITYALIGDSQGVGMRRFLRAALAPHDFVELGAAVQVGIRTIQQVNNSGNRGRLDPSAADLAAQNPALHIVVLGGNDINDVRNERGRQTYTRKLRQLVELLTPVEGSRLVTPVVWVGPARVRTTDHPQGFYRTPSNRERTREEAEARQQRVQELKDIVNEIQREFLPTLGVAWLDGFAMTRDLQHRADGLHFVASGSRTWAQRISVAVRRLNLPQNPPPPTGSHVASLAQRQQNERVFNENRTRTMQGTVRSGLYNSANGNTSARQTAAAIQTSRLADISERDLRIPVIVNARGFNFETGLWVNENSSNSDPQSADTTDPVADNTDNDVEPTDDGDEITEDEGFNIFDIFGIG